MIFKLLHNGKYKEFKTKNFNAKLYIELANLLSQINLENSLIELLQIAKKHNIDLTQVDADGNLKLDESKLSKEVIFEILELQNRPKDYSKIAKNYELYCKIIELVTETKFEFTQEFWDNQNYSEVESIITQFRSMVK